MERENAAGVWIYRAMIEDNGQPKLGSTALTLGVRSSYDIEEDAQGLVHLPNFLPGEKNGMSCAPSASDLPPFALPVTFGGHHKKSHVWKIKVSVLNSDLVAKQDGPRHSSIGPARTMLFTEFREAIQRTAADWIRVT